MERGGSRPEAGAVPQEDVWLDDAALMQLLSEHLPEPALESVPLEPAVATQSPAQGEAQWPRASSPQRGSVVKNASRERLKAERQFLRAKVVEMERQASELQAQKAAAQQLAQASVWRPISKQQQELREQAQQENAHLKHVLAHQISVGKSLESLLHKRSRSHSQAELYDYSVVLPAAAPDRKRSRVEDAAQLLFMQFEREIDERVYPMVDEVLGRVDLSLASTMEWVRPPMATTRTDRSGREQVVLELSRQKWVPFSFASACDAAWRAITQEFQKPTRIVEASIFAPHLIALKDRTTSWYKNQERSVSGAVVTKKFVEDDRMIAVWRSMSSETSTRRSRRAYTDEMGWCVVQRVSEARHGFDGESAVATVCARCIPLWGYVGGSDESIGSSGGTGLSGGDALATGELTTLVLDTNADEIASIVERMGNILLEDTQAPE